MSRDGIRVSASIGRQPEAVDEAVVVEPLDLVAEREEALAGNLAGRLASVSPSESCAAANRMSPPTATTCVTRSSGISTRISSMTLAMSRLSRATWSSWRVPAQVEPLAQPDGAERVDAGPGRLAAAEQREAGAAAADLDRAASRAALNAACRAGRRGPRDTRAGSPRPR